MNKMEMSDLQLQIADLLDEGYKAITVAAMLEVSIDLVHDVMVMVEEGQDYDDSMDGDFDSGMASAGYGTDEDYGYYGDE
jgi:hypothetical protein